MVAKSHKHINESEARERGGEEKKWVERKLREEGNKTGSFYPSGLPAPKNVIGLTRGFTVGALT